jgi:superfamily II DNA or RNA helicase
MVKGDFVHKGMVQRVMQCICFADVFDTWKVNNPFAAPTMLFAPGVPESKWFVEQFERRGVKARHIDGDTPDDERNEILDRHREGDVKVISSYGVLREGADLPWAVYGILVQVCGALSTYLQIVGRLLRAFPGKERATLQDHSGCWWRHGSPNINREWQLGQTDKQIAKERTMARQRNEICEPICCPRCAGLRIAGPKCPHCGYEHTRSVRAVRMVNGQLKKMVGDVIKPKFQPSQDERNWKSCLYAAAASGMTVRQAAGRFHSLVGRWPRGLPNMPEMGSLDWNRAAGLVFPWLLKRKAAKVNGSTTASASVPRPEDSAGQW